MTTKLRAASFQDNAVTTAKIAADAVTNAKIADDAVQTENVASTVNLGRRNLIINGAMQVAQRGTSFTSTADLYTLDRFAIGHGTVNAMTVTQETDAPSGFQYSLKVLTGTGASSGAAGYGVLRQAIEGTNMYHLKFGTSDAESVTLSFYVKSSLTGTFAVSIRNQAGNRAFAATYTISSANTWEYKTITIAGDTSGTWTADTGIGLHVQFDLGAGSNYDIATGAWTSGSNMFGGESTVKLTETTNATWFLTGLQVELGSVATPFEHRSFGEELALCQRYYYKSMDGNPADNIPNTDNTSSNGTFGIAMYSATSGRTQYFQHPVQMRADPSVTVYSSQRANTSGKFGLFNQSSWVATATSNPTVDINRITFSITHGSSLTAGYAYLLAGGFDANAEL